MEVQSTPPQISRLPRFRRAPEPLAFQLTEQDVDIVRLLARYRFLRSSHIATLVGRSLDRTNDRLSKLFHASYIDRPRAQLDYYPGMGSAPMVYALADRGARLLIERDGIEFANVEWSRKNRRVGRPFIDHQLAIVDFYVSLRRASIERGFRLMEPNEIAASMPERAQHARNAFAMRVTLSHRGAIHEIGVIPDFVFCLSAASNERRNFFVEIDRGTMPVARRDFTQTSFERKMRAYLAAYAAKMHEKQFGWKSCRILTVTTDRKRARSMMDALRRLRAHGTPGPSLFYFATRDELATVDPLRQTWTDGTDRAATLI